MARSVGLGSVVLRWCVGALGALVLVGSAQAQSASPRPVAPAPAPVEEPSPQGGSAPTPQTRAVILVTVDGVRWQELFGGTDAEQVKLGRVPEAEVAASGAALMPNFHARFVENGVVLGAPGVGQPVQAAPAAMSLPGYMELLSGHKEELCVSNRCPATRTPTLLDDMRRRPGGKYDDVAAISSWEVIERAATNDPTGFPMSYGRGYGITRDKLGVDAQSKALLKSTKRRDPFPGYEDYRPDWITGSLALRYLQAKKPKLLFIGLGDADEYGHRGDYRSYQGAIRQFDAFLGQLFAVLDQMGDYGAGATVIVTTDHGRGAQSFENHGTSYPESRRIWLGAAGGAVPRRGLVAAQAERRLADVAPSIRVMLGLKTDTHEQVGSVIPELFEAPAAQQAPRLALQRGLQAGRYPWLRAGLPLGGIGRQHGAALSHRALSHAAIFALSALCLAFEIAQIRVFSYAMDPHVVFGAIAMAMLGLGVSGVLVAVRPSVLSGGAERLLPLCAVGFGGSSILTMVLFARLSPLVNTTSLTGVVVTAVPLLLLCSVPYAFVGLGTTALLSGQAGRAHGLYLFNLLGSALGCFVLYPLLRPLGVEPLLAGLGLIGALVGVATAVALKQRRALIAGAVTALLGVLALARPAAFFPFLSDPNDLYAISERTMAWLKLPALPGAPPGKRARMLFSEWDPVSRVEVFEYPTPLDKMNEQAPLRLLLHDGGAGSLLFGVHDHPEMARALFEGTTYGGAYTLVRDPRNVLIIGLGGGPDIMTAHHYGAKQITGVEVNGSTLRATGQAFAGFLGDPYGKPNVRVLHLDGRSFVEGTTQHYDLIQLSGTDTYSAAGGGAFLFSESYLYTVEALERYMQALKPNGVLAMIRFGPEPLRLVISEIAAMRSLGITDPRPHLAILRQGPCEVVMFSRSPIDDEQKQRAAHMIEEARSLPVIKAPLNAAMGFGTDTMPPLEIAYIQGLREEPGYARILAAAAVGHEREAVEPLEFDYSPVTDDRPFFFQFLRPSQLGRVLFAPHSDFFARGLRGHLWMLFVLCLASAAVLLGPLWLKGSSVRLADARAPLRYFSAIGTAYLLVELALMQQTALFMGHPTYSISVTLCALLAWSGLGSLLAGRFALTPPALLGRVAAGIGLVAVVYLLGLRPLLGVLLPLPLVARGVILFLLLAPLGMLMGMPFPTGLRAAAPRGEAVLAWAQAANALSSVVASLMAAPLAMFIGFRVEFLLAVGLYAYAAFTLKGMDSPASPAAPAPAAPAAPDAPASPAADPPAAAAPDAPA